MWRVLHFLVLLSYFILPIDVSASDKDYVLPVGKNEIKVMSYNVENLFDAEHDAGKTDYEFLPKSSPQKKHCYDKNDRRSAGCAKLDWTTEKVDMKLEQIKKVIRAQGSLPDVLVLVEVENPKIVGQLADLLGYDGFEMTNSPDVRGIDCAVLYLTKKMTPQHFYELEVDSAKRPTRNLSALVFQLDSNLGGGLFAVFPNHWPSQGNTVEYRIAVARALQNFVDDLRQTYAKTDFNYVITGDFNTINKDNPNPIDTILLSPKWDARLVDVHDLAKAAKSPMIPVMPQATYFYGVKSEWNEFDRFFVNRELQDQSGLEVDPASFRIHAPSFLTKKNKQGEEVPFRYNHNTTDKDFLGYSDHFAVVMKLRYEKSNLQ